MKFQWIETCHRQGHLNSNKNLNYKSSVAKNTIVYYIMYEMNSFFLLAHVANVLWKCSNAVEFGNK